MKSNYKNSVVISLIIIIAQISTLNADIHGNIRAVRDFFQARIDQKQPQQVVEESKETTEGFSVVSSLENKSLDNTFVNDDMKEPVVGHASVSETVNYDIAKRSVLNNEDTSKAVVQGQQNVNIYYKIGSVVLVVAIVCGCCKVYKQYYQAVKKIARFEKIVQNAKYNHQEYIILTIDRLFEECDNDAERVQLINIIKKHIKMTSELESLLDRYL